jgi:hypothetical protein
VLFAVFSILVLIPLESREVFWRYLTLPPILPRCQYSYVGTPVPLYDD